LKVSYIISSEFCNNNIFQSGNSSLNSDGHLDHILLLRQNLLKNKLDIGTWDINTPEVSDLILVENIFHQKPLEFFLNLKKLGKPMVLIASESLAVLKENSNPKILSLFDHVFTYHDNVLENEPTTRISKFNYTFDFPDEINANDFCSNKLLCLIQSNKRSSHWHELYSERVRIARWFEKYHPSEFTLYGHNWDKPEKAMVPWFRRKILHHGPWKRFFAKPFSSYKGLVESKHEVYQKFKFSLCFENVADISGYITEKIFDSMLAGNIPIYRGADNISDYIPPDCFIDYRKFDTIDDLYQFLANFTMKDYLKFIYAVNTFINSDKSSQFRHQYYVDSVSNVILNLLDKASNA
jgi:alpha(1,3/1,4) fucosyltransferase